MVESSANKETIAASAPAGVGRNVFWMVWSGGISIANSVLVWAFLARMREAEELGRFTIVMGLYTLFYSVCSLGLMPYLVTEISRRSEQYRILGKTKQTIVEFIASASLFLLISGALCAVLMIVCGFLLNESPQAHLSALVMSVALIPTGLICIGEATAISFERTRLIAFVTTLENALRTIFPLWLIWSGFDISVICLSFVAVRFAALAIYARAARGHISKAAINRADLRAILKVAPTFAATIIFASINWQAPIILLGLCGTEIESAKFGVASRFLIPVTILMASYASAIQPVIVRQMQKSIESGGFYLARMAGYPLILSGLAAAVSPFLSRQILIILFGEKYAAAAPALDILAFSVVPFCLVMIAARGLIAAGAQRIDLLANALGVAVCFAIGAALVPAYGANGAATAQLLSFLLMAAVETVYLSKKLAGFKLWRTAAFSLAGLSLFYAIVWNYR